MENGPPRYCIATREISLDDAKDLDPSFKGLISNLCICRVGADLICC